MLADWHRDHPLRVCSLYPADRDLHFPPPLPEEEEEEEPKRLLRAGLVARAVVTRLSSNTSSALLLLGIPLLLLITPSSLSKLLAGTIHRLEAVIASAELGEDDPVDSLSKDRGLIG